MRSLFLDATIPVLAAGADHPVRRDCRAIMATAGRGDVRLHMSVEAGQEFLFHRLRRGDRPAALAQFDELQAGTVWHSFDAAILQGSRDLIATGVVRGRDAVHAATALAAGFSAIVSTDRDFDGIPGLRRLDPREAIADLEP